MGEVYRAQDPRIGREVAIKVLPAAYSSDPDRLRRFEQEVRAAGALNHPNVLTIYDVGTHDGSPYIVSELLEGETLRARLAGAAPLPQRKAVEHALEMARGLAAAHEKGIVHRDLKPDNLFVTKAAGVKILDFGLAKLTYPEAVQGTVSHLPATPGVTEPGVIMGTAGYMSPEQVRGQTADHRADIFAFGAILYEMLKGRRAFAGDTPVEALNAILKQEPPELSGESPLERMVRRCLEKEREERFQSARDLAFALETLAGTPGPVGAPPVQARRRTAPALWMAAALLVLAAVIGGVGLLRWRAPEPAAARFYVYPPEKTALDAGVTVSPDGRHLAFTALRADGPVTLWVRALDSLAPRELPATEGATLPFWSPDSRSIGFFAGGKLKTISLAGGSPQTLCDTDDPRGGAWSREGVILFGPNPTAGLYRVPASGGKPERATALVAGRGEATHRWPQFLPDHRSFLFFIYSGRPATRGVYAGSLGSKETRLVLNTDRMAIYAAAEGGRNSRLLFLREGTLMSQPFDAGKLQLTGEPTPVAEPLWRHGSLWGLAAFSTSHTGILAYRSGGIQNFQMEWLDRQGKSIGAVGPPGSYEEPWLAPDEKRVALIRDPALTSAVWILDTARGTLSRLTFDASAHLTPVWSPDGRRIAFAADHEGTFDIYAKNADGTGTEELMLKGENAEFPGDWSLDGRFLLYETITPRDLWALPLAGDRKPLPIAQTEFDETQGHFSPDGKWVAFVSNETGRYEVYVQPFPGGPSGPGAKWQVSTSGGVQPQWRRDGKELFFLGLDRKLMAVEIQTTAAFRAGSLQALFQWQVSGFGAVRGAYVAAADGRRFLVIKPLLETTPITVVLNWAAGLKQ